MCKIMKSLLWPRCPSLTADPGCDSHTDAMEGLCCGLFGPYK